MQRTEYKVTCFGGGQRQANCLEIAQLTDDEASDACLALTTLLETVLPVAVDTSDLETLVEASDSQVASLYTDLRGTADEDAAEGARSLLLLTADLGFEAQVEAAA